MMRYLRSWGPESKIGHGMSSIVGERNAERCSKLPSELHLGTAARY